MGIAHAKTNAIGETLFRNLPAGLYRVVEISNLPEYEDPIYIIGGEETNEFEVSSDEAAIIEVAVENPIVDDPTISKDVEGVMYHIIPSREETFTWNGITEF